MTRMETIWTSIWEPDEILYIYSKDIVILFFGPGRTYRYPVIDVIVYLIRASSLIPTIAEANLIEPHFILPGEILLNKNSLYDFFTRQKFRCLENEPVFLSLIAILHKTVRKFTVRGERTWFLPFTPVNYKPVKKAGALRLKRRRFNHLTISTFRVQLINIDKPKACFPKQKIAVKPTKDNSRTCGKTWTR